MKLFSQSILVQVAVIVAVMALLWWGDLAAPAAMTADGGAVLYGVVARWLAPLPLLAVILAMVLILAEGVALNLMLADHGLTPPNSMLPTLLYVVAMSAAANTLTPMILAAAMLVACTRQLLLKGPLLTISTEQACTATAFIGLASLFYLPAVMMMVGYLLVAVNYRLYSWKDWAVLFLGFLSSYVLLLTVLMFTEGIGEWWQSVVDTIDAVRLHVGEFTTLQALGNAVMLAVMVAGVVRVWRLSGERTVVWQKNAATMLSCLFGAVAMLFVTRLFTADMQPFAAAFAFCVTCLLTPPVHTMGRKRRHEWIYVSLLILTIIAAMIC